MTDRHDELLQARLDGELTSDQRLELERLLAETMRHALRAGELEALVETLNLLEPEDPPARVLRAVIDHVHDNAPEALNESQTTATGGLMRTKVLWGLAAAAGIVLAVLAYTGFPPESGGSEGAIGAAKRYQAGQMATSDVKLGDQAAQEFLQSDLFDKLMKDETVVAALTNPAIDQGAGGPRAHGQGPDRHPVAPQAHRRGVRQALADAALQARRPAFGRALRDPAFGKALADPGFGKALSDVNLGKALSSPELAKAFSDPAARQGPEGPGAGQGADRCGPGADRRTRRR